MRFAWRRDGLLYLCLVGLPLGLPFGLAVFGLVWSFVDPNPPAAAVCFLSCMGPGAGLAFAASVIGVIRTLFTPSALVDPEIDRFDLHTLPWRVYRLTVAAARGVEVLVSATGNDAGCYWLAVRVEGRLVYVRQYAAYQAAVAEAGVTRAADVLASALGVPVSRREMTLWERLTTN